jgi:hypothetical protein
MIVDFSLTDGSNDLSINDACRLWSLLCIPVIRYIKTKLLDNDYSEKRKCNNCRAQFEKYLDLCFSTYGDPNEESHGASIQDFTLITRSKYGTVTYQEKWNIWTFIRHGPIVVMKILSLVFDCISSYLTDEINSLAAISSQPLEIVYLPKLTEVLHQLQEIIRQVGMKHPYLMQLNIDIDSFDTRINIFDINTNKNSVDL